MQAIFLELVKLSLIGSLFAAAVMLVRLIFPKMPKWLLCLLWGVVALRLICPVTIESRLSLVPDRIASGQIITSIGNEYIGGVDIIYESNAEYSNAVEAGRQPVPSEDTYYVVTEKDSLAAPKTVEKTLYPVLSWIWAAGMVLMLGYTVVSYMMLRRKMAEATHLRDNIWQCEQVDSPFVLGFVKPKIYLPYAITDADMVNVIAHEKAHIHRKDHWWKPIGFILLSIHWFNPILWLAYAMLCRDIEAACDEKVIKRMEKDEVRAYSTALLNCSVNRRRIAACPLAFGEVGVKERVKTVMNYKKPALWIVIAAVALCAVVAVSFLTNPIGEKNEVDVSLLEFPGVKWNATPEEVKNALNLTNDQIVKENTQEADPQSAVSHEGYTMHVRNLSLLGADILNAKFSFLRYEGNDFGLCAVEIYYPKETDMQIVVDHMADVYGEGTNEMFVDHTFRDGKLIELKSTGSMHINGELWAPEKDPDYIRSYWRSTKKGTEVLSADAQSRMANFYAGMEHLQITPEVALELLEKQPMVQVYAVNRNPTAARLDDKIEGITHNYVRFAADYLVMMIQRFGTNSNNQETQLAPSLLEFPDIEWGATVEEVKQALSLTDDQIYSETYTKNNTVYDECYLYVTDIPFFGENVSIGAFHFRADHGQTVQLFRVTLHLDENADMDKLRVTLTDTYGQDVGEYFAYYSLDAKNWDIDHDTGEIVHSDWELRESKKSGDNNLWYLANNPPNGSSGSELNDAVAKIVNDPDFKTYNWVSSVRATDTLSADDIDLLKDWYESKRGCPQELVQQWLEKVPLVYMSISNRSLSAAFAEVNGITEGASGLTTHNQVIFDADMLLYMDTFVDNAREQMED